MPSSLSQAELLLQYLLYISPGLLLLGICLALIPPKSPGARIAILIAGFVLMRDAMTPMGIWAFRSDTQIAFTVQPVVLIGLGLFSLGTVFGLTRLCPDLGELLVLQRNPKALGSALGLLLGILLAVPLFILNGFSVNAFLSIPLWTIGLIVLSFGGNALEELLFRGFLQGHLETVTSPLRAALASGVAFAAAHSFLALTVTQIGWPILLFTLTVGIGCGLVRLRYGLVPAILTHGTTMALISVPMAAA